MYVCYLDEAGEPGVFKSAHKDSQPVFVLLGIIFPISQLRNLTSEFIDLKRKHYPSKYPAASSWHDAILTELKGSELRKTFTKNARAERQAKQFLTELLALIQKFDGKIIGKLSVKQPDAPGNAIGLYSSSMQNICRSFQGFLEEKDSQGIVISDSRDFQQNGLSSHSIFTQKFRGAASGGDAYPRIIDMPTFGESKNHAGIQIADLLASAMIFPMAAHAYCDSLGFPNKHVQGKYSRIRDAFRDRISSLQYRYVTEGGQRCGGITVSDAFGRQHGGILFSKPITNAPASQDQLEGLVQQFKD